MISSPWSRLEEMRSARDVHGRLLAPGTATRRPGIDYAAVCRPERGVGGDFHDLLEAAPGRLVLVAGDVSGKGVPAALLMASLRATLRCHYALDPCDLGALLRSVNRLFLASTQGDRYASLFVGELEEAGGRLRYANCGHVPPILVRRGLRVERLRPTATVVGLFEDWTCEVAEATLADRDLLVLVSDGVTEIEDRGGTAFGASALMASVLARREERACVIARTLADDARAHGDSGPDDDRTVVVVRYRRPPA